ncbi:MAG: sigma-70 family RNA polymerase sigma factor [Steroidobacter sp.]
MQDLDDKSLMLQFQADGDPQAFEEVFRRNKDSLFRFLLRLSGNVAVAEDISQHAWLRVIELAEAGRYAADESASFRTFLFTLARNRYIDKEQRSHESTHTQSFEQTSESLNDRSDDEILAPELLAAASQVSALLDEALCSLPPEQREIMAWWIQGVDLVEVARITGVSWATLVSRKKYALKKIRTFLEQAGVRQVNDVIA